MISIRRYLASTKSRTLVDPMLFVDDIYRYALAKTVSREDAEDIAIEVAQQAPDKSDATEMRMYMIGMARRKIADHFRKKSSKAHSHPGTFQSSSTTIDQMIDVQRVLETVSDSHRECLILKYVTGLTSEEIAKIMDTNSEAVDSLLQRARKSFAIEWENMHGEPDAR